MYILKNYTSEYWITVLVVLAMMFPYSPSLTQSSTQPIAPALLLPLIFFSGLRFSKILVARNVTVWLASLFFLLCLVHLIKLVHYSLDIILLFKYFVAFSFFWFGATFLRRIKAETLNFYLVLWAIGASAQVFFPGLLVGFVSGQEVSAGRGVTSFAPEPSFLAIHMGLCFLVALYKYLSRDSNTKDLTVSLALVFYTLLLSQSATGLIIALFCVVLFSLRQGKLHTSGTVRVVLGLTFALVVMLQFLEGTRAFEVFTFFSNANYLGDQSFASRFFHIALGVNVLMEMKILGYSSMLFADVGINMFETLPDAIYDLSLLIDPVNNGKIHSLFAHLMVDYGVISLIIIIAVGWRIYLSLLVLNVSSIFRFVFFVFLMLLLLLPIPIGSPIFFSVIGLYSQRSSRTFEVLNG